MARKAPPKAKMPTMYDVAMLAGVSQPTVSRVLNQNATTVQISDQTRQRVMAAVEKLGYLPNVLARSVRTQRTQTIAQMIADLSNGFYHPIARAVQDVAHRRGYEVLIPEIYRQGRQHKLSCAVIYLRFPREIDHDQYHTCCAR